MGDDFELKVDLPHALHAGPASARQEQVLDGVEHLILRDGFRALRLRSMAAQIGTSYSTLYGLAATKVALVLLVTDRFFQRVALAALEPLRAAPDARARLEVWTSRGTAGVAATAPAFWADAAADAAVAERVALYRHFYSEVLIEVMEDGIARGVFRPVDARLLAVVWEAAGERIGDSPDWAPGQTLEQLSSGWVDLVLHGVLED